ncbi:MAG: potassium transporter TrkA [Cyclobacteriaceae bacterium]
MASVLSLIIIVTLSALMTRFASRARVHTVLSRHAARFQARLAFTGQGFAFSEAERIVAHPVRRLIIMILMLVGNVGIISILASLLLTFVGDEGDTLQFVEKLSILAGAFLLLFLLFKSKVADRWISRWIDQLLDRYTNFKVRDFSGILHLADEYEITKMLVNHKHWVDNRRLNRLKLRQEGLNLIGIERADSTYLDMPGGDTEVHEGEPLILCGRESVLKRPFQRIKGRQGGKQRRNDIAENQEIEQKEKKADRQALAKTES